MAKKKRKVRPKPPADAPVAYIFDDPNGYKISDDRLPYLDATGPAHRTVSAALTAAWGVGYQWAIWGRSRTAKPIPPRYRKLTYASALRR